MRKVTLLMLAAVSLAAVPAHAARVEIILDVSGSMRAAMGGETRMDAARKAIRATLAGIQPESVVALRLYGHRVSQDDKAGSCKDTELTVPFQPVDKAAFQAIVDRATPRGQTPLTYSLEQAARDFGPASDEDRVIILVSDGAESCGGDPTAAARALQAQGFKLKVHTVGFDVDAAARAQLEALSNATGGEYHDARNAGALADSLTRLAQKSLLVTKTEEAALGQPIRGGDGYSTAVPLQSGVVYRLDHHQRKDQYDYFYLPLKPGQKIRAFVETTQDGVKIKGDSFQTTQHPYAGLFLHDATRQKRGGAQVTGARSGKEGLEGLVDESHGDRVYVLVGSSFDDQHKDSRFQVTLEDAPGDAGSASDAGATPDHAMAIAAGSHTGQLAGNDRTDMFKFTAEPQVQYRVTVRLHKQGHTNFLGISAETAQGDVIDDETCHFGRPTALDDFSLPQGGEVFLRVKYKLSGAGRESDPYTLEVVRADQAGSAEGAVVASNATNTAKAEAGQPAPSLVSRLASVVLWSGRSCSGSWPESAAATWSGAAASRKVPDRKLDLPALLKELKRASV